MTDAEEMETVQGPGYATHESGGGSPAILPAIGGCRHAFSRSGVASLKDLRSSEWADLFAALESAQAAFARHLPEFRSPHYRWPGDALHRATRVWEYPYVLSNLLMWRRGRGNGSSVVLDLGSGVTFFPFALAREGFHVIAVDSDPVCADEFPRAISVLSPDPGSVRFERGDARAIPLPDASADAVICVSVLEHCEDVCRVLREVHRVLAPGGVFVVTVDLDLRGNAGLDPAQYDQLRQQFGRLFVPVWPEVAVHPRSILTSHSSPYGYSGWPTRRRALLAVTDLVRRIASPFADRTAQLLVTTYATCLQAHQEGACIATS